MNNEKNVFKQTSETNTDVFIYGEISKKNFWTKVYEKEYETKSDLVEAVEFSEMLKTVTTPNITVHINSMGGSVSEGLTIYNLLNDFKGEVTTVVDGFACSAASIIFMAGKKRIVPESALLMIHNAQYSQGVYGDSNALRKYAEDLEKITQPSVNIYKSKTRLEEQKIKEMMDKETWLTSQETFDMGFATAIEKNEAEQSLNDKCLYSLIMKIKELEKVNKVEKPLKKDTHNWGSFFN